MSLFDKMILHNDLRNYIFYIYITQLRLISRAGYFKTFIFFALTASPLSITNPLFLLVDGLTNKLPPRTTLFTKDNLVWINFLLAPLPEIGPGELPAKFEKLQLGSLPGSSLATSMTPSCKDL